MYPSSVNRGYSLHSAAFVKNYNEVLCIHPLSIEAIHSTLWHRLPRRVKRQVSILCQSRLFTPRTTKLLEQTGTLSIHPLSIEAIHSTTYLSPTVVATDLSYPSSVNRGYSLHRTVR